MGILSKEGKRQNSRYRLEKKRRGFLSSKTFLYSRPRGEERKKTID